MDLMSTTVYGFEARGEGIYDAHLITLPDGAVRRRLGTILGGPRRWGAEAPDGKFASQGHKNREDAARALHRYYFRTHPPA